MVAPINGLVIHFSMSDVGFPGSVCLWCLVSSASLNLSVLRCLNTSASLQGIIQLSVIFMQIAPITLSFAVVNMVEASVRSAISPKILYISYM